jgi:hypothetical protein
MRRSTLRVTVLRNLMRRTPTDSAAEWVRTHAVRRYHSRASRCDAPLTRSASLLVVGRGGNGAVVSLRYCGSL